MRETRQSRLILRDSDYTFIGKAASLLCFWGRSGGILEEGSLAYTAAMEIADIPNLCQKGLITLVGMLLVCKVPLQLEDACLTEINQMIEFVENLRDVGIWTFEKNTISLELN